MLKTIPADKLVKGMFLHKLCGSWINHPFWKSKFVIDDAQQIKDIIDSGITEVVIDTSKGLDLVKEPEVRPKLVTKTKAAEKPKAKPKSKTKEKPKGNSSKEWKEAKEVCQRSKAAMAAMFQDVRMGKIVSTETAAKVSSDIARSVESNTDVLLSMARLKTVDDYTYMHSVAVCAMMVALGREIGLKDDQIERAGLAALLHDLGKASLPLEILNKPGKLTEEEFAIIKGHPKAGYDLIKNSPSIDDEVLDVVLHHHEKLDGSGYPDALPDEEIQLFARMAAICDVYDAITSTRPYKSGWDPAISIKRMLSWEGHFDKALLQSFIRSIGIYPTGSLVKLASDRLGVVSGQTPGNLLAPKVRVFFNVKQRQQTPIEALDLAEDGCEDKIVSVEDSRKWGFTNLEDLWAVG